VNLRLLHADDRLALLVAVHHAAGSEFAPEERIRVALARRRLRGPAMRLALNGLHADGLVIPCLREGWGLTAEGWACIVNPTPEPRPTSLRQVTA
jgi:hypothetical protein